MIRTFTNFSETEDEIILKYGRELPYKKLMKFLPGRSENSIKSRAARIGALRSERVITSKLPYLLEDTVKAYYLIGFILADGNISKRNTLRVGVALKDSDWFKKSFSPLGVKINTCKKAIYFECFDNGNVEKIKEKFNLKLRKTYNPPENLSFYRKIPDELFLALFIGFVDGDGHIAKAKNKSLHIRVDNHFSWFDFSSLFKERLEKIYKAFVGLYLTKGGKYVSISIGENLILRNLYRFALDNHLPIMERKWSKININHRTRVENKIRKYDIVKKLLSEGLSFDNAAKEAKLSWYLKMKLKKILENENIY